MHRTSVACLASLIGAVLCKPIAPSQLSSVTSTPYPNRPVIEFPIGTWAENLAVRSNGQLLVTVLNVPQLLQVDPLSLQESFLIHEFPNPDKSDGLIGIVEMEKDIFYVLHGNFTIPDTEGTPGTYSVWKVDMNPFKGGENGTIIAPATVSLLANIPEAAGPNGLTALNKYEILIADCKLGVVFKLNVESGAYQIVLKDPLMTAGPLLSSLGVNGIKILDGYLYFTNTQAGTFNRIPINSKGEAAGPSETIQGGLITADDFIFDSKGDAYIAQDAVNVLTELSASGQVTHLVGSINSTYLAGATAVQFGRTELDKSVLYVTTNGGQAKPGNSNIAPGKVVAVYTETHA